MAEEKAGKLKVTFEVEINQPIMELIKQNMDAMTDITASGIDAWRKNMGERRRYGHGMGMMIHHNQE